uniref:NHS like 3 n=1 Tax=Astyanax mexicanus TaxID=7994 RepID=A0A3B1JUW3_ASTMX
MILRLDPFRASKGLRTFNKKLEIKRNKINVFIEGSRPKYLEDLHTEAQEGLKILQQEGENKNNIINSSDTTEEKDVSLQERDGSLDLDPTADHSSNITLVSSRPPAGGLLQQLPNGEDSAGTVIIPTIDGGAPITNHEGAYVHLQDIEALQASRDEQLLRHHLQVMYGNDLPRMSPMQRPKSLAVPGMTTMSSLLQEQGPVMSISPQATYLSTIIPNAVLPAAIDVIEIDRSHTRRSVRTVSKSSLASASPGSSRSGGGNHDGTPSYSSKRSNSQSSETLVSNSSRGNRIPSHAAERKKEDLNHDEQISVKSSSSCLSSSTKAASHKLEQGEQSEPGESVQNSQFSRSLSIMKAKLPPAPPRRTYSLHQEKMKQRSNKVDDKKDLNGLQSSDVRMSGDVTSTNHETISTNSPVTTFLDNSHLSLTFSPHSPDQDSTDAQTGSGSSSPQNKFERTVSPSSGYSSQSGTPTHSSKDFNPTSPGKHKKKPPKPERIGPRTSPVVSVSSSTNSLSSAVSPTALAESNKNTSSLLDNDALTPKAEENGTEDQYSKVKPCTDKGIPTHRHKENASIDAPRVNGHSPPPSPPPTYHPPPPPSKRSPASSVSTPLPQEELPNAELGMEKEYPVLECAWPPPPPPMDVSADLDQPNAVPSSVNHLSQQASSEAPALATEVPTAPPLPMEEQSTLSFRRQPSPTSKDIRSKELLSRHKSAPIPKEDANIPLVTPSLLQMVRLRSVNVEDQVNTPLQEGKPETEDTPGQDQGMLSQVTPQKPIRKSCIKSTQPSVKSSPAAAQGPSMRLQEAIRMKTAAMSSSGVPARLSLRLPTPTTNSSNDTALVPSPKSPDSSDLLKSPASTASFIFSKSTKKVVIETPTSPEVQASLKQNLAAELMQISDQAKSLETKKQVKVPPPVAKKPAHATNPVEKLGTGSALTSENSSSKQNVGLENGQIQTVQPAGQRAQSPGTKMPASKILNHFCLIL